MAPVIIAALPAIATAVSAGATIMGGLSQKANLDFQAKQVVAQGNEARAVGQRKAAQRERETGLLQSRLQARAAAGGGDTTDVSTLSLTREIGEAGTFNQLLELATGENRGRSLDTRAAALRTSGKTAKNQAFLSAAGTILGQFGSMAGDFSAPSADPWAGLRQVNTYG